jgi:DNA polymerase III delta subunit
MLMLAMSCSFVNSQSISVGRVYSFLKTQDQKAIVKELVSNGFSFSEKTTDYGISTKIYSKTGSYGKEGFTIGFNNDLFLILYHPAPSYYSSLKEKVLTSDFVYAYKNGNAKYYENGSMRIGINDTQGNVSFYVKFR